VFIGWRSDWGEHLSLGPHRNCAAAKDDGRDFVWEDVRTPHFPCWRVKLLRRERYHVRQITPTRELIYHRCWRDFECARLAVPLDWTSPDNGETAAIAITKYPGNEDEGGEWGGPVLVNPGTFSATFFLPNF
jgi:hypothetical protein